MAAVVMTSLMLGSILRTGKSYVNEEEEAEFMARCRLFVQNYKWVRWSGAPAARP